MISDHQATRLDIQKWPIGVIRLLISTPFIYAVVVPVLFLDVVVSLYQFVCFPLYNLQKIKRNEYVQFDRGKMEALQLIDRIHCHYCSYVNGVIGYAKKIVSETERMWCPIKHKAKGVFIEPSHQKSFVIRTKRADLEEYYKKYEEEIEKHPCENCDCDTENASAKV